MKWRQLWPAAFHVPAGPRGELPPVDETVDCVLSTQVLEHVEDPKLYLAEAYRVLLAEGSLVQGITYAVVPDQHPPSAAGHVFTDNTQPLIDAVAAWLAKQHL